MDNENVDNKKNSIKIAAMADLHTTTSTGVYQKLFSEISKKADILLLCGDLTDNGLIEEAESLKGDLKLCTIPILAVLGNHDFDQNNQEKIKFTLSSEMMTILDGDYKVIKGIGFAGTKGFAGGFDDHMVGAFGEQILKLFVQEAINETLKLEKALGRLETEKKIVLLHYSPIKQTVIGENPEVLPLLGTSRLEDSIDHFKVSAAFHGHAHHGTHEGKTVKGIPVYNVSYMLMKAANVETPFALIEI